ncbi:MAG: ribosome recycling factor [Candidatus Niyogibacteria bacterium CG10_big_fil_rev_8_21_14_0_10_46_36]|uniref:Ribosome recycling factor n=1 Tax=Candidatus Niyogibacteria bacterium CG10_big_fil_rev_8_21_14_0_10_46_36 TaxID=1974726 RepID=A0A2H0TE49_9BACT|nr:MAG: ribosome recycling factor [Candidatus Niyogibacteria bacterium CG10_big_fil_rev_8_21_14_0_10_46_36]
MAYDFSYLTQESDKIKDWLQHEISGLRTGRASPQLVENVKADYYGQQTPIKHIAAITIQDAHTIVIQPWDKSAIPVIEKALNQSEVGIKPVVDKDIIRLTLPELTGERREQLKKVVREKLEEAKITLRKIRHEVLADIEEQEKAKEMSEDDKFRYKEDLQKHIEKATEELDAVALRKTKEIES